MSENDQIKIHQHRTAEFEKPLTEMGVEISLITYQNGFVKDVMGIKDGMLYVWMADGKCYRYHDYPRNIFTNDLDIKFENDDKG